MIGVKPLRGFTPWIYNRLPKYTLGGTPLKCVQETKYLGVTMQADLKFTSHITAKTRKANKVLGCIRHTLHDAPQQAKLLAYKTLCRPILEYSDTVWDPVSKQLSDTIELGQNQAAQFIKNIKGRRGVTQACSDLALQPLQDRRKNHRLALLLRILSAEDRHEALASAYDELVCDRSEATMTTRAASRGEPTSIYAATQLYYNSFLPRTVRDLRLRPTEV